MKKIAYFVVAILSLGLLLAACNPTSTNPTGGDITTAPAVTTSPTATTAPTETTAPTQTSAPTETTTPTQTTETTSPTVDPQIAAELEAFDELFRNTGSGRNLYFWATGHEYASTTYVKLKAFFDGGFEGEHEMTDAEGEVFSKMLNFPYEMYDHNRLPKDKMDAELQAVFGISLADLPDSAYEGLLYLESTDCYYFFQTGMTSTPKLGSFFDLKHNDDGTISLIYENGIGENMITLKPNGDSYLILSNVKVK